MSHVQTGDTGPVVNRGFDPLQIAAQVHSMSGPPALIGENQGVGVHMSCRTNDVADERV